MDKKQEFTTAVKNNEGLIYKIAAVYTNDREDRNDLVQEIIYQLWKSFDSFNREAALSTWMYRIAMNTAIYYLKAAKKKVATVPIDSILADFQEPLNNDLEEKWQTLRLHLNKLNLLDKGIVMLYLDNKSYEEIAAITGISATNVGTKLSRIKEKLRQQITKQV